MRDPAINKQQVDGPFTNDLIRDVNVAALGVMGCRDHGLAPSAASFSPRATVLCKPVAEDQYVNTAFLMPEPMPVIDQPFPFGLLRLAGRGEGPLCAPQAVVP